MNPKNKKPNKGTGKQAQQTRINLEYLVTPEDPSYRRSVGLVQSLVQQMSAAGKKTGVSLPEWLSKMGEAPLFFRPSYFLWWKELTGDGGRKLLDDDKTPLLNPRPQLTSVYRVLNEALSKAQWSEIPSEWRYQLEMFIYYHLVVQQVRDDPLKLVKLAQSDASLWSSVEWQQSSCWAVVPGDAHMSAPTYGSLAMSMESFLKGGSQQKGENIDKIARMTLVDLADILTRYDCIGMRTLLRMSGQGELMLVQDGGVWDVINDMEAPFIVFSDRTTGNRPVTMNKYLSTSSTARYSFHIPQDAIQNRMVDPTRICILLPGFFGNASKNKMMTVPKVVGLSSWMVHPSSRIWNYVELFERLLQEEGVDVMERALFRFFDALPLGSVAPPTILPGIDEWCALRHQPFHTTSLLRALFAESRPFHKDEDLRERIISKMKEVQMKMPLFPGPLTAQDNQCLADDDGHYETLLRMFIEHQYAWKALDKLQIEARTMVWVPLLIPARGFVDREGYRNQKWGAYVTDEMKENRSKLMAHYREDIVFCNSQLLEASQPSDYLLRDDGAWGSAHGYLDRLLQGSLQHRHFSSTALLAEHVLCGVSFKFGGNVFDVEDVTEPIQIRDVHLYLPDEYNLEEFVGALEVWRTFVQRVVSYYVDLPPEMIVVGSLTRAALRSVDRSAPFQNRKDCQTKLREHYTNAKNSKTDRNTQIVQRMLTEAGLTPPTMDLTKFRQYHFEKAPAFEYLAIPLSTMAPADEFGEIVTQATRLWPLANNGQGSTDLNDKIFVCYQGFVLDHFLYALESIARRYQTPAGGGGLTVDLKQILPRICVYKQETNPAAPGGMNWRLLKLDEATVKNATLTDIEWLALVDRFFQKSKQNQSTKNTQGGNKDTWTYKPVVSMYLLIEGLFQHMGLDSTVLQERYGSVVRAAPAPAAQNQPPKGNNPKGRASP